VSDDPEETSRRRWLAMRGAELAGVAGAVFGLVLMGRAAGDGHRWLGAAILVSAMIVVAVVPRHLARRWRSPKDGEIE